MSTTRRLSTVSGVTRISPGAGAFDWLVNLPPRLAAKLIRSGLDAQYDYYTEPASH